LKLCRPAVWSLNHRERWERRVWKKKKRALTLGHRVPPRSFSSGQRRKEGVQKKKVNLQKRAAESVIAEADPFP